MSSPETARRTVSNAHAFRWSLASAGAGLVLLIVMPVAGLGPPADMAAVVTDRELGRLLFPALLAALLAGLVARRSRRRWPWWWYVLAVLPLEFVLLFSVAEGAASTIR
jgi:hypothetical protein